MAKTKTTKRPLWYQRVVLGGKEENKAESSGAGELSPKSKVLELDTNTSSNRGREGKAEEEASSSSSSSSSSSNDKEYDYKDEGGRSKTHLAVSMDHMKGEAFFWKFPFYFQ